jgi:hypothetical protein
VKRFLFHSVFRFERLSYSKIPIWENKRRIEYLAEFRDLLNAALGWNQGEAQLATRHWQLNPKQRRAQINKRKRGAHQMVTLAGTKTRRRGSR